MTETGQVVEEIRRGKRTDTPRHFTVARYQRSQGIDVEVADDDGLAIISGDAIDADIDQDDAWFDMLRSHQSTYTGS